MKTELTTVSHSAHTDLLNPATWNTMWSQANVLVKSGFLPTAIKTPEQAIAIMMKGYEIGIPVMQAFSHINIIQGKPACSAELQMALIFRNCRGAKVEFIALENDHCIISASRPGHKSMLFKFDRTDAENAQLLSKDNWKKWPRAMYRSRCVSEMARTLFPDAIMGMSYTTEELNPDAVFDDEGQITVTAQAEPKVKATSSAPIEPIIEQATPVTPAPDKTKKIFNMHDAKQHEWLSNVLLGRKISADSMAAIIEDMHDKDILTDLEPILEKALHGEY